MKELCIVANYTIKEMIKRKSFILSTIIILVLVVLGFNIPNILNAFTGTTKEEEEKILLVDSENLFEDSLEKLNQMGLEYQFEIASRGTSYEQVKEKIEQGEINSAIIFTPQDQKINTQYVIESEGMTTYIPKELLQVFSTLYANNQLEKLNLTQEEIANLYPEFEFSTVQTTQNAASGNIFIAMMICLVLFFAIYFCAYQVSTSITTEKTSRIMETLVTSTTPRTIVLGKTIGIGIVGLIQIALIVLVAVVSASLFMDSEIISQMLDLSNITPMLAILTIIYFLFGYAVYALLYALTGSTVSKPEDVQSANGPVAIVAVIGFYLAYFSMMNPSSGLNVFASIFPFSSPFCMPLRILLGTATIGEILGSIAVLIITILIIAHISIKIYSSAILNYGSKLSIKDIFKNVR